MYTAYLGIEVCINIQVCGMLMYMYRFTYVGICINTSVYMYTREYTHAYM